MFNKKVYNKKKMKEKNFPFKDNVIFAISN